MNYCGVLYVGSLMYQFFCNEFLEHVVRKLLVVIVLGLGRLSTRSGVWISGEGKQIG